MPTREEKRDDLDRDDAPRRKRDARKGAPWLWIGLGCGGALVLTTILVVAVILIMVFAWPSAGPAVTISSQIKMMPGLIAFWSFDEVKGDKVTDHSGRNNHLTLVGGRIDKGMHGKSLWLDGPATQFCEIPATDDFNFAANEGFTFSGWAKTSLGSATVLSLTGSKGNQQIDVHVRDNRFIVVVGDNNDDTKGNAFVWSKVPNDGGWHHFALIRRAAAIQLWLDGVLQGEMAAGHSGGPITTDRRAIGSERAWIATNDQRWGNPSYQGGIDEVCVFNRAIEPAEIQVLLEQGR